MATFPRQCAFLAELFTIQNSTVFQGNEEFHSYITEYALALAVAFAIQDEIVEATSVSENLINLAFEDLAEMLGMDSDSLGSYDSLAEVINLDSRKLNKS
jgi:hypothetical protein